MIGRRNLMAIIGLAPVAAVAPPSPVVEQSFIPATSDLLPIDYARKRLAALQYARNIGLRSNDGPPHLAQIEAVDPEVMSMRSWSPQFRARIVRKRREKLYEENYLAEALARVEREVKLSMAPAWVKRFL